MLTFKGDILAMKKKILVCFGENLESDNHFTILTDKISSMGFEVHLVDRIIDMELKPHNVLNVLEHIWQEKIDDYEYYFLSNVKNFFKLIYRCFHQSFEEFIFYSNEEIAYTVELDDIYKLLLEKDNFPQEKLYKKIYTNDVKIDFLSKFFNEKKSNIDDFNKKQEITPKYNKQLIYRFQGQCYMLEPFFGEPIYINLDEETVDDRLLYSDIIIPCELNNKDLKQAEEILVLISKDYETCLMREEIVHKVFSFVKSTILTSNKIQQKYYCALLEVMGNSYGEYSKMFVLSLLLQMYRTSFYYKRILQLCIDAQEINKNNKYFILAQIRTISLIDRIINAEDLLELETELFKEIVKYFDENIDEYVEKYVHDLGRRDIKKKAIVVLTDQFLDEKSLKSKYLLELCKVLIEKTGKEVWLFNTCEYISTANRIPFFDASAGHIMGEYSKHNYVDYGGCNIPYCQLIYSMPTDVGIAASLEFLYSEEIALIINTSALSVMADIASERINTISIFQDSEVLFLPVGQYLLTGKKHTSRELNLYSENKLELVNYDVDENDQQCELLLKLITKLINGI